MLKKRYGIPISLAAELYRKIGEKIKQKNGNIWEERIYVSFLEKLYFSLQAIYKLYFRKKLVFTTKVENKVIFILKKINVRFD